MSYSALSKDQIIEKWRTESNFAERDALLKVMIEKNIFPQEDENILEKEAGLYPDVEDPNFLTKLLTKQEFAEHKQLSVAEMIANGENPCDPNKEFELNPVQRFIGQYLSPKTPYNSALLFHGVGVGKTCSAITVAEAYLERYPKKQVIIVAPRNIQPGFLRTIFNEEQLRIGEYDDEPNEFKGCTGNTYLKLTGNEYNRNPAAITKRVNELKAKRYQLVGYFAFYKYLYDLLDKNISKKLKGERRAQEETKLLAKKFSGRLIIIDEAHNLRDLKESDGDNLDAPYGDKELSEAKAARRLTPYLRKLLDSAEGTKLLLLTATPMYNSYREIIPLLNFLLINDKKKPLDEGDIFNFDGSFTVNGEAMLGKVASAYISFMRGENPLSFPIRLDPEGVPRVTVWPHKDPQGRIIEEDMDEEYNIRNQLIKLPFIPCEFDAFGLRDYRAAVAEILRKYGTTLAAIDGMVQAGNFIFPVPSVKTPLERIRDEGFSNTFVEEKLVSKDKQVSNRVYKLRPSIPTNWLYANEIGKYSPKTALLLNRLQTAKGVCFVYSRFVISGALTIALALEANGYTLEGRDNNYLAGVPMAPGGRQCALCYRKEEQHVLEEGPYQEAKQRLNDLEAAEEQDYNAIEEANAALQAAAQTGLDHTFVPAKYVLLTGRDDLTPSNKLNIDRARADSNLYGEDVKVVIGSQVASEGIDLRFIRESFVFDSWFHLSKLEQVIGRAIRMCSHALLDPLDRNCTINLLLTVFPSTQDQETMDMFQYRQAFEKAKQVGMITRVMKQHALDCNLNHEAVMITQLDTIEMRDGQGEIRPAVDINDTKFTSLCDYLDTCDYKCAIEVPIDLAATDESTYDYYSARWRESQIKNILRQIFTKQTYYQFDDLEELMAEFGIPRVALASILAGIVGNRGFRIQVKGVDGYIIYKNKLYLFQPEVYKDTFVPLAIRSSDFPVKQDSYEPIPVAFQRPTKKPTATAITEEPVADQQETNATQEVRGDYKAFWSAMTAFLETIKKGKVPDPKSKKHTLSAAVSTALLQRYSSNKKSYDRAYNSLSMVVRLYEDIKGNPTWRTSLAMATAKFIWDEFLNNEEQYRLYQEMKDSNDSLLPFVWQEHIVSNEGVQGFRRLNPLTGKIEFMCDGQKCTPVAIALLEKDPDDDVKGLRANTETTGKIYGTLNFKNGSFVFKTNTPVSPSSDSKIEKQEPGQECANVSNMAPHYKLLEEIGEITKNPLNSKLGLTMDKMFDAPAPRSFRNSVRACALTDIVLRFLDELLLNDKRWFYRPLASYYTGHKGRLRKEKSSGKKKAE